MAAMTYWAREDPDGPWLESEVLVGASVFELRPLVGPVPSRSIPFDTLARVEELHRGPDPGGRTIRVASTDGTAVQVRGPAKGMGALIAALGAARAPSTSRPPVPPPAPPVPVAEPLGPPPVVAAAPPAEPPVAGPPVADAGARDAAAPDATAPDDVVAVAVEGATGDEEPARSGIGARRLVPFAIAVLAFIVALGFWNYRSNQQDLRETDGRRVGHEDTTSTTTSAPGAEAPVSVEGATTTPSPAPTSTTTHATAPPAPTAPTSTRAPTTTRPPATPAGPQTLSGTVALQQVQHWSGIAPACRGVGALADVTTGATVTVQDASGTTVATGTLGACTFVVPGTELRDGAPVVARDGAAGGSPRFDFRIVGVPESEQYSVRVGRYDPVSLRRAEFGSGPWRMRMVISAT